MKDMVKKAVKTGFGLGILSLAEAKKVAGKVKKELKLNEKESLMLARELVASSEKVSKDVLGKAQGHFEAALVKTGLTNKKELTKIKKVIKKRVQKKICGVCGKKESMASRVKKAVRRKKK
jgi:hypothetical protein